MLTTIKEDAMLEFEFNGKLVRALVHKKEESGWVIMFGEDLGGSWFKGFKEDWLLKKMLRR